MDKIAKLISFIIIAIFVYLIITTNNKNSKINSDGNLSISKIETFSAAKEIIPGQWIATEKIYEDLKEHSLLLFSKDGSVRFAQGSSSEKALKLAQSGNIKGKWSIVDNPNYLNSLIHDQRFLIEINLDPSLNDLLRVEIDFSGHRMGRISNDNDAMRESSGLFTFGGKIFHKQ